MNYNKLNTILGWLAFIIALLTYGLTVEPANSFWDCGEFIASAYKLEVGHPPGAPLFMMVARVFSLFAFGNLSQVALMINFVSVLSSAFTILFLFWTITHIARKVLLRKVDYKVQLSDSQIIAIMGSGLVGALAYTFSDTFWFSAVEGEVYASSSLFTAVVFWAILKWESVADEKYANRWIILIAYLMGLSIGVHLLNLLAIPAMIFVYYFKKYKATQRGIIITSLIAVFMLGTIQYGIIPGVVSIASKFELIFVNSFGLPFYSGIIFYAMLLIGGLIGGLYYTLKHRKRLANTIILAFTLIILGYSSFSLIVIRSLADTPMDENNPENVFALLSYLNREQYGNRPLVYGHYFSSPIMESVDGKPTYTQQDGKYVNTYSQPKYIYHPKFNALFPRMYSQQQSHISAYKNWSAFKGKTIKYIDRRGEAQTAQKPTFVEDLRYFINYQLGFMYFRYFMWNFAGRQNDIQGHGGNMKGNWMTGIKAIDEMRLGSQDNLPNQFAGNKAHNNYYMLPLLLGLLGFIYLYFRHQKEFWVLFLFFLFMGIAIVVFLNQTPYQPRERDYAYAGSFYAFAIYIGLGVLGVYNLLKIKLSPKLSASLAVGISLLLVPTLMASENWDDHDRSGRYTARDFAKDYLDSCAPDAIIFTYGDNDTFPLWYVQEVEGYRTDVRIVNLSLLATDWYITQMKRQAYQSAPVPFSLKPHQYIQGKRDLVPIVERIDDYVSLKQIMDFVASDEKNTKLAADTEDEMDYLPSRKFTIAVDSAKVVDNGTVSRKFADKIVPEIRFSISQNMLSKSELMVLDLMANNNWERPIYFATSVGEENFMGLGDYFQLEGFAYRLVPIKTPVQEDGTTGIIDPDILYENLINKFTWGNMQDPDVFIDHQNIRTASIMDIRGTFARLAGSLIVADKKTKAIEVLDKCMALMPNQKYPYNHYLLPVIEAYYAAEATEKANNLLIELNGIAINDLRYFLSLSGKFTGSGDFESRIAMHILNESLRLTQEYQQIELFNRFEKEFEQFYSGIPK